MDILEREAAKLLQQVGRERNAEAMQRPLRWASPLRLSTALLLRLACLL